MYGDVLSNKRIVEKLFISLTLQYDNIMSVLEGTKKVSGINPIEVVATPKGFELRLIRHSEDSEVNERVFSRLVVQGKKWS